MGLEFPIPPHHRINAPSQEGNPKEIQDVGWECHEFPSFQGISGVELAPGGLWAGLGWVFHGFCRSQVGIPGSGHSPGRACSPAPQTCAGPSWSSVQRGKGKNSIHFPGIPGKTPQPSLLLRRAGIRPPAGNFWWFQSHFLLPLLENSTWLTKSF